MSTIYFYPYSMLNCSHVFWPTTGSNLLLIIFEQFVKKSWFISISNELNIYVRTVGRVIRQEKQGGKYIFSILYCVMLVYVLKHMLLYMLKALRLQTGPNSLITFGHLHFQPGV